MTGETPRDEIIPLWPTWVGQLQLPDADAHNRSLIGLATTTGVAGNLFAYDHDSVRWLRGWVETSVAQWFERARVSPAPEWTLSGALEALQFGQYREPANLPGAYLAGIYFVNKPAPPELGHLRSDSWPSHLSLLDPRVGFNALSLDLDHTGNEVQTLAPVPGMLMLWPGYLRHFSRVHLAHAPWVRVTLRIDLVAPYRGAAG